MTEALQHGRIAANEAAQRKTTSTLGKAVLKAQRLARQGLRP
jgi:hypothetical protein